MHATGARTPLILLGRCNEDSKSKERHAPVEVGVDCVVEAIVGGSNVVPPLCKIVDPLHVIAGRECGPKLTCTAIGKLSMGMLTL